MEIFASHCGKVNRVRRAVNCDASLTYALLISASLLKFSFLHILGQVWRLNLSKSWDHSKSSPRSHKVPARSNSASGFQSLCMPSAPQGTSKTPQNDNVSNNCPTISLQLGSAKPKISWTSQLQLSSSSTTPFFPCGLLSFRPLQCPSCDRSSVVVLPRTPAMVQQILQ